MRFGLLALGTLGLAAITSAAIAQRDPRPGQCQQGLECRDQLTKQKRDRRGGEARRADRSADKAQLISYGADPLQAIDYYASTTTNAPLVLFVHGGGWKRGDKEMVEGSAKLSHWRGQGYAVASLNYRLVPEARVEDQAADVAAGLAALLKQAPRLGFDPNRVVLVGHSAGAHLVAFVGTDPQWLRGAGLGFDAIKGVVPLDGAGYHVPSQMGENQRLLGDTYKQAFGTDPERQKALSPTLHAEAPNAPAFLILHVERKDAKSQSEGLARALRKAGTPVELEAIPGRGLRGHMEINRNLGEPAYPATPIVDRWLAERFGKAS